jgi:uncharacterized protein
MRMSSQKARLSRRAFASTALGVAAAGSLLGREDTEPITQASVPGDPEAPRLQSGTVPEALPFHEALTFTRKDVSARVRPFSMTQVRLLPSAFKDAQEADRALLHTLPADRLLHTFRLNAGLPTAAQPLGGWEKPDCELRGHYTGHFLSACALMYASTGDRDVKAKGDYMVGELAKCQQKLGGGYLSAFPIELFDRLNARKKVWAPFYTVHKIMAGMLDMHQHCDNKQALEILKGMAGWADKWTAAMPEEHMQMVLDTEYGGMNEVLYNLAAVTGDNHFAAVGDRFTKKRFFNPLALRRDQLRGLHTNTHIPQVIGAARRYEISGDQRFHDVADNFWEEVIAGRTYVTGGTSNNEGWLVEPNHLAQELKLGSATNECCCAYNMLKLTRQLYTWTADPRYFDYYERALYNHRLGTIDTANGETQYYLGIVPGSWRTFATVYDSFWCCNGTGVEEYGKLNDSIYFYDENSLYVNLFIPSELNWTEKGIRVRQTNRFPEVASTHLAIDAKQPSKFALHVRIPAWVADFPTIKVNGKVAEVSATPGSYVTILRTWRKGDQVEVALPMRLHIESMPDDRTMQAILYGPLVLAGELGSGGLSEALIIGSEGPDLKKHPALPVPSFQAKGSGPSDWISPAGKSLTFRTVGQDRNVTLVPFNQVSGQRYSVYWNVT